MYVRLLVLSVLDVAKIKMEVCVGVGGNHAEPLVPGLLVGLRHGKHRRKMGRGREEYQTLDSLVYSLTVSLLFRIFWYTPYQSLSHPINPSPSQQVFLTLPFLRFVTSDPGLPVWACVWSSPLEYRQLTAGYTTEDSR